MSGGAIAQWSDLTPCRPKSEVKCRSADGSVGSPPHVRVGSCHALIMYVKKATLGWLFDVLIIDNLLI
nr:hypothetical protein [Arsenophonus endosymbiont of Aleurodicus floccissimus]